MKTIPVLALSITLLAACGEGASVPECEALAEACHEAGEAGSTEAEACHEFGHDGTKTAEECTAKATECADVCVIAETDS